MGPLSKIRTVAGQLREAGINAYSNLNNHHDLAIAAGLSYYFLLSLFPALIFAAAVLPYMPIPDLFNRILDIMSRVAPQDSMALVRKIVSGIVTQRHGGLLSVGMLGMLWSAAGGFTAVMEGLNIAYEVPEKRAWWKTRLLAVGLTFLIGALVVVSLGVMIVGPEFGTWLSARLDLSMVFAAVWPVVRWAVAIVFVVLAVELIYFLAPNVKQRFKNTLPGALLAVVGWMVASYLLGFYFRHFANYNKTYGTLGAVVALMLWFYVSGIALLFGAEINSGFLKACGKNAAMKEVESPKEKKEVEFPKERKEEEPRQAA
jgi:membrane protein